MQNQTDKPTGLYRRVLQFQQDYEKAKYVGNKDKATSILQDYGEMLFMTNQSMNYLMRGAILGGSLSGIVPAETPSIISLTHDDGKVITHIPLESMLKLRVVGIIDHKHSNPHLGRIVDVESGRLVYIHR